LQDFLQGQQRAPGARRGDETWGEEGGEDSGEKQDKASEELSPSELERGAQEEEELFEDAGGGESRDEKREGQILLERSFKIEGSASTRKEGSFGTSPRKGFTR